MWPLVTLTVSLPAVAADGQAGDGVAGDARRRGRDLHLDCAARALLVGLEGGTLGGGLDGVAHLRKGEEEYKTGK